MPFSRRSEIDLLLLESLPSLFLLLARARHFVVRWRNDRNDKAQAGSRKHLAPIADQALVGSADISNVPVEVIEAERVDVSVLLAKRGVPVDLVGQRIPGEADGRD